MPHPETHLFWVNLTLQDWHHDTLALKMPVWTPGSYMVREYSRHLQNFSATTLDNSPLTWEKVSKNHWRVNTATCDGQRPLSEHRISITYRIYANELTVRTNHLDQTHGYFNGAALFLYSPEYTHHPLRITIEPPHPDWLVSTPLMSGEDEPHTFIAPDFNTLVDSPFEIGTHAIYPFEVLGKPHEFAVWGHGNFQIAPVLADTQKIIEAEATLFAGLPYDRYLFILHLFSNGFGGLEHKNACSLIFSRFGFGETDSYQRFMQLVAHEFFHLWNIKRIRPQALEQFDYDQENYTPSLWFSEGTTSYYDLLLPLRAGIYGVKDFFKHLSRDITRYLVTPGRMVQPLQESSFDAWIKLYRPDANSSNSQMSYYLKGSLVSLLLDLKIRLNTQNQKSLDDVMRQMWQTFGVEETGFTPAQLQEVITAIAQEDLTEFWHLYFDGTEELPIQSYLEPFGLELQAKVSDLPYLGCTVATEQGRTVLKAIASYSPAQKAGLDSGDELLALNGVRVSAESFNARLKDFEPGDVVELTVFHHDDLWTYPITLGEPQAEQFTVSAIEQPTPSQTANRVAWLGN
jgi:predicted metalloprotease with PDZ domain